MPRVSMTVRAARGDGSGLRGLELLPPDLPLGDGETEGVPPTARP